MEIVDDIYKISGEGNVFVILKPTPIVIDTGNPTDKRRIKKEIEMIVPLEEIKTVILTHLHYDHSGNIDLFPNAKIYADEEEIEDFNENKNLFFFYNNSEIVDILKRKLEPLPKVLNGLKILKVPGHTRGSVAILDEKRKIVFSGDTVFQNGIGRTDFANSAPEKMYDSVDKISKLIREKNYLLCPGHDY
ncbi:MAG: MBL fold metallo-hydrolase [archaeon]